MNIFGMHLVGINTDNAHKLILSVLFVAGVALASGAIRALISLALKRADHATVHAKFWTRQSVGLLASVLIILGIISIWFPDPTRLATALGLFSAGLAFALQQVVTSIAGYFVILRGANFMVGDRISMGGVRGDVLRLGFIQTTIMEMGDPIEANPKDAGIWVKSRQFTGRIVTVSNARIFSDPVYNYTRDFPYIWEEIAIPITYKADRSRAEAILLEAARLHSHNSDSMAESAKAELQRRFGVEPIDLEPRVFYRLTDNWLELTVRFVLETHRIRAAKDAISRYIIGKFDEADIGIASSTYDIVGFPALEVKSRRAAPDASASHEA